MMKNGINDVIKPAASANNQNATGNLIAEKPTLHIIPKNSTVGRTAIRRVRSEYFGLKIGKSGFIR